MSNLDCIGFDVHKKSISFCAKAQDGRILDEGKIVARRSDLNAWVRGRSRPWVGALEATLPSLDAFRTFLTKGVEVGFGASRSVASLGT